MTITPAVHIPLQDIVELKFRNPTRMLRGSMKFLRASDSFGSTQEMIFTRDDFDAFASLRDELERDRWLGVTGNIPEVPPTPSTRGISEAPEPEDPGTGVSNEEFRAKYKIPKDVLLAVSPGEGFAYFDGHYVSLTGKTFPQVYGIQRVPQIAGLRRRVARAVLGGCFPLPPG